MREFVDTKSLSRPAFLSQKKIKTEEDYNFEAMQKMKLFTFSPKKCKVI